jgi:signal transduction histidine kinase
VATRDPNGIEIPPRALLETLAQRLPIGMIVLHPDGKVIWSNAHARRIFAETPDAIVPHVEEAFAGHEIHDRRVTIATDRRRMVLELTAAPLGGSSGGVAVAVEDVTQRDRAEQADAEFVQNAAHQLRNPMTAIASSVAALNAGARDEPAERDRFLAYIGRESERMGSLVDALLTLAALQRGDVPPRIEVVPLRGLLEDAADAAPGRGGHATVDCGQDIAVVTDRALLAQAVANVVANAVDYARSNVSIVGRIEGATAVVDIRDDGPGIPPEDREHVFERFFRGADVQRTGSGLGLAIARAAAEAAQSTLELLPPDGPGTTFRFTIPGAELL